MRINLGDAWQSCWIMYWISALLLSLSSFPVKYLLFILIISSSFLSVRNYCIYIDDCAVNFCVIHNAQSFVDHVLAFWVLKNWRCNWMLKSSFETFVLTSSFVVVLFCYILSCISEAKWPFKDFWGLTCEISRQISFFFATQETIKMEDSSSESLLLKLLCKLWEIKSALGPIVHKVSYMSLVLDWTIHYSTS